MLIMTRPMGAMVNVAGGFGLKEMLLDNEPPSLRSRIPWRNPLVVEGGDICAPPTNKPTAALAWPPWMPTISKSAGDSEVLLKGGVGASKPTVPSRMPSGVALAALLSRRRA